MFNLNWLYFQIHGKKRPRNAPRKPRKGPPRDSKYLAWVRGLRCTACDSTPSEAAHTGSDGGMSQKASDYTVIPLCTNCHTQAPDSYHRLGKSEWEGRTGINCREMVRILRARYSKTCCVQENPEEEQKNKTTPPSAPISTDGEQD